MSTDLIAVVEIGSEFDDESPYPSTEDEEGAVSLVLEDGENVLWRGAAKVATDKKVADARLQEIWELPEPAEVLISDRRVAYICERYDTGSSWVGGGAIGLSLALTATAISKKKAANRRQGKVAIGQVRYEWPMNVMYYSSWLGNSHMSTFVGLSCFDGPDMVRLKLKLGVGEEWAAWLAQVIAYNRAHSQSATSLSDSDLKFLKKQAEGAEPKILKTGKPGGLAKASVRHVIYELPGYSSVSNAPLGLSTPE